MPRTVVPPVRLRDNGTAPGSGDGYLDRLIKYVPAETLAFFVPISAMLGNGHRALLIVVLAASVVGTVGYLWKKAPTGDESPAPHYYPVAVVAFLCWAIGTDASVAALIHVDHVTAGVVLGVAVFLLPLVDDVPSRLRTADQEAPR